MAKTDKGVNAGVHGSTRYEFQKHCALHILFDKYAELQNRTYFICLEHHDDVLFCYQTQAQLIQTIDAYQAKKSSGQWGMGEDLATIFKKLTQVGLDLLNDNMPKEEAYTHKLRFITNGSVKLNCKKRTNGQSALVNETNQEIQYVDLHPDIKARVLLELQGQAVTDRRQLDQLADLSVMPLWAFILQIFTIVRCSRIAIGKQCNLIHTLLIVNQLFKPEHTLQILAKLA